VSDAAGAGGAQEDRILPDEVTDGAVPDADLATDDGQLGGADAVEANDELEQGEVHR
jgi:hypothetical protein